MMRQVRNFVKSPRGSMAPTFAISAVALVAAAGVALDFARGSQTQAKMQSAADSAILAAARAKSSDDSLSKNELTQLARKYFDENGGLQQGNKVKSFKLNVKDDTFELYVDSEKDTTLMAMLGFATMDLGAVSFAEIGPNRPLEIALVLDNTGSMSGSKLAALKDAANKLVETLLKDQKKNGNDGTGASNGKNKTRVALVPFSKYVNVGLDKRTQPWIDVPNDYSETKYVCWNTYPNKTKLGCTTKTGTGYNDGVPYTYTYQSCRYDYGDPVEKCGNSTKNYKWYGCVGSRDYPGNVNDHGYGMSKVPGLMNTGCSAPVTPLTSDLAEVTSAINGMKASGSTYIPAGLSWGWRLLSSHKPFKEAKTYKEVKDEKGIKAIVLMTDGANTKSPNYPKHDSGNVALANQLTEELCTNIKTENITIYTIAFEVSDPTIKSLLKSCATNTGMYYSADNSTELVAAFDSISGQLSTLRLTK